MQDSRVNHPGKCRSDTEYIKCPQSLTDVRGENGLGTLGVWRYRAEADEELNGRVALKRMGACAMEALTRYDWPGNIRELQNVLERSVILSHGNTLQIAMPDLGEISASKLLSTGGSKASPTAERQAIIKALDDANGQVGGPSGAAARLGMKRTTLQSRMRKLSIARQYR